MVMTIEGTDVKTILSHEAQGNDNVIKPMQYMFENTASISSIIFNIDTLKTLPKI